MLQYIITNFIIIIRCGSRVSACIDDITKWMASNRLIVNPTKTDVLWCSTSQPPPDTPLSPAGTTVRNLGVLFDADLSLAVHVNQLTARCNSSLRRIENCRRALSRNASVTLINSLIVSRLDYCNSVLAGCSKQLVDKLNVYWTAQLEWSLEETVEST